MLKNYKHKYESSKKAVQSISRYNYYVEHIVDPHQSSAKNSQECRLNFKTSNNLTYIWHRRRVDVELLADEKSLLHAVKTTHLGKTCERDHVLAMSAKVYQKNSYLGSSFLMGDWFAKEVIEFVIKTDLSKLQNKVSYELFIIHHCNNQDHIQKIKQLKWLHFVEKYVFRESSIDYELVAVLNEEKTMFGFGSNIEIFKKLINSYMKLDAIQGHLLKYQDLLKEKRKESGDPAFNEETKLIHQIPSDFLKVYYTLRKQFGAENEQLICRYMIARNFQLDECRKEIQDYIKWSTEMENKYKWEDFQDIHQMRIFVDLGQDYQGRPVILNIARNFQVDKIDHERYCDYYMYFLEIYMPKQMRGYVTQQNFIVDLEGIGQNNYKWSTLKKTIDQGKKYCAERQYKLFAINVSSFAHFCYKFIKPILPKKTLEKVYVGGNDKSEILENLLKDMSIDVIPTYLGGQNPII